MYLILVNLKHFKFTLICNIYPCQVFAVKTIIDYMNFLRVSNSGVVPDIFAFKVSVKAVRI